MSQGRLVGEVLVYFAGSDRRAELGLWMRPGGVGADELVGLTGALIDRLILRSVASSVSTPVSVGNMQPRRLLEIGGFTLEGTLAEWRPIGNVMSDMDVYGLTARVWREAGRRQARAICPWPDLSAPREVS